MTPEHTADEVPVESDGADTLSLVERLRSSDPPASATTLMLQAADEIERLQRIERNRDMWKAQCERQAERLRSQGGAPEGWRLVPVEPTEAMTRAGIDPFLAAHDPFFAKNEPTAPIYRAMLSAAPQPPSVSSEIETRTRPSPITAYCEPDDDRIFALLCARKDARTDDDAAAIAWAEDEIADLRKDRASVVELANKHVAEIERLRARVAELEGALRPFAEAARAIGNDPGCLQRGGCGCADKIQSAISAAVSAERSRVIEMCVAWHDAKYDEAQMAWRCSTDDKERTALSHVADTHRESAAAIRSLGKPTGGAE